MTKRTYPSNRLIWLQEEYRLVATALVQRYGSMDAVEAMNNIELQDAIYEAQKTVPVRLRDHYQLSQSLRNIHKHRLMAKFRLALVAPLPPPPVPIGAPAAPAVPAAAVPAAAVPVVANGHTSLLDEATKKELRNLIFLWVCDAIEEALLHQRAAQVRSLFSGNRDQAS